MRPTLRALGTFWNQFQHRYFGFLGIQVLFITLWVSKVVKLGKVKAGIIGIVALSIVSRAAASAF